MSEQYMVKNESARPDHMSLPKNIRQMGTPGDTQKVYIEDYVYTYLHNFLKEKYKEDTLKAAIILGDYRQQDGVTYAFVKGAIACDFSQIHEQMSEILAQQMDSYFPEWEPLGWYVSSQGVDSHIQSEIKHYYARDITHIPHYLIYEDELEREIQVFAWEQNALHYLNGYYIYYEKNPRMQEFLIMEKGGRPQEMPPARTRLFMKEEPKEQIQETVIKDNPQKEVERTEEYRTNVSKNLADVRGNIDHTKSYREPVSKETANRGKMQKNNSAKDNSQRARDKKKAAAFAKTRKPQRIVYAACAAVLILLAAMGISQMGDYQNLKNLQEAISNTFVPAEDTLETEGSLPEDAQQTEGSLSEDASETSSDEGLQESPEPAETTGTEDSTLEPVDDINTISGEAAQTVFADSSTQTTGSAAAAETSSVESTSATENTQTAENMPEYYVVQKGDSLYSISRRIYENEDMVEQICQLNGITNLNLIYEGQKLKLP